MIPATFTLLVAAASTNALPIFSGFFAPRAVAPAPAATIQRRDLNNTQFAQGTNFYFASLLLETECTPGQVACIDGKTATCSAEANWEVSPCSEGTTCYAVPASTDPTNDAVVVKCMTQEDATSAFGSSNLSEDFQITAAPFNTTVTPDPSSNPSDSSTTDVPSDSSTTDVPSGTETFSDEPTSTGDDSTPTDSSLPDGTCTEDPEPTETETITVIAISDAQNSDGFSYSTVFPTATETDVTDVPTATETATETATIVDVPTATSCAGTTYQPTELTTCDQVATLYGISSDDVYNNNNFVDCNNIWAYTVLCLPDGSSDPAPSDSSSDQPTPTDSSVSSTEDAAPTTLSVPASSPSTPANVVSVPEVSIVDTHVIPASSSIVPPANLKMRKVRRS